MNLSLNKIILFVQNVELLKLFYQKNFHFDLLEEIKDEWVVLKSGNCELALHKSGVTPEKNNDTSSETNNVKLVFETTTDLSALREELIRNNVQMNELKSFDGFPYLFCDGKDAEGNVFQLTQKII